MTHVVPPNVGAKLGLDSCGHIPPASLDGCPQLETLSFSPYGWCSIHNAVLFALGFHSFCHRQIIYFMYYIFYILLCFDNPFILYPMIFKKKKKGWNCAAESVWILLRTFSSITYCIIYISYILHRTNYSPVLVSWMSFILSLHREGLNSLRVCKNHFHFFYISYIKSCSKNKYNIVKRKKNIFRTARLEFPYQLWYFLYDYV